MRTNFFKSSTPRQGHGFTLIEMAIVLIILTLVVGGALMPLNAQIEQRRRTETQKMLEEIKEALIGFAVANGRLPCPAIAASNGMEDPADAAGGNACTNPNGFVPAVTLGIMPIDDHGFAIDGWGSRIRYAVTQANSNAATTSDGIKNAVAISSGITYTGMSAFSPDLHVCASSTGVTTTDCGTTAGNTLTASAPALIYSLGPNWSTGGTGNDEAENLDADVVFVSHVPSPATSPNGEFDDMLVWISPNILFNRMVAAGRLP